MTALSIIALICLGFIAWIFITMETENTEGGFLLRAILAISVGIPAGVIVGGLF